MLITTAEAVLPEVDLPVLEEAVTPEITEDIQTGMILTMQSKTLLTKLKALEIKSKLETADFILIQTKSNHMTLVVLHLEKDF